MSDNIKLELVGMKAFNARLGEITFDVAKEVRKAINQGALMVKTDAIKSIKTRSFGRVYGRKVSFRKVTKRQARSGRKRGNAYKQKIHIASKPGDAPNVDTGNLWRNIRVSSGNGIFTKGYFALVRARTPYAVRLEYGGSDSRGRYIAPRPFMGPAMKSNEKKIQGLISAALRRSI